MDYKYNISNIAKDMGVSISTVSRAINGKKGVSEEQRQRILSYAQRVGYQVRPLLAGNCGSSVKMVAIVLGDIRNAFYTDLVFNIQKILNENGYMVVVFNSEYDVEREISQLYMIERANFAGLILITASTPKIREIINGLEMPMVLVNRIIQGYEGDSVLTDNFQAGYMATMHLIELNHKKIGFIRGPETSSASSKRYEGYLQAMRNYNIEINQDFIYNSDLKVDSGKEIANKFINCGQDRPTAFVVVNDLTAIGFMNTCRLHNISIPDDLSIVSFDDIWCSSLEGINLTSVSQHAEQMSREASRMILKRIRGETCAPELVIIPPTLVVRKSTCAPAD